MHRFIVLMPEVPGQACASDARLTARRNNAVTTAAAEAVERAKAGRRVPPMVNVVQTATRMVSAMASNQASASRPHQELRCVRTGVHSETSTETDASAGVISRSQPIASGRVTPNATASAALI